MNLLELVGAAEGDADARLRRTAMPADEAVRAAGEAAERRREIVRSRIDVMRGYAETTDCRRRTLLGYFGETLPAPCGTCDNCDAGTSRDDAGDVPEGVPAAQEAVRHPEFGDGVVMSVEPDRMTVLFTEHGYRTLALDAVRAHDLVEPVEA